MDLDFLSGIREYQGWVSPPSFYISVDFGRFTHNRFRRGLLETRHRTVERFLTLEIIIKVLQLPIELQEEICRRWRMRDFRYFYWTVTLRDHNTPSRTREWCNHFSMNNFAGLGGISLPLTAYVDSEYLKAWEYGMCNGLYKYKQPWPKEEEHSFLYNHFTKFQKEVFLRATTFEKIEEINGCRVISACMDVNKGKIWLPHYLIFLLFTEEYWYVVDPVVGSHNNIIRHPWAARAKGFFYIYFYINKFRQTDCGIFKVGNTTFIITPQLKPLMQQAIDRSESIELYLAQIEAGHFLDKEGHERMIDMLITWDREYTEGLMLDLDLDNEQDLEIDNLQDLIMDDDDDLEANMGEEGVQNLND